MSDFDGYEKGVAARVLLGKLIKRGRLVASPDDDHGVDMVIPLKRWQLEMLAVFSEHASRPLDRGKGYVVKAEASPTYASTQCRNGADVSAHQKLCDPTSWPTS